MEKTTGTNTNRFQYQEILDNLAVPCPPPDYRERETVAYRWVFDTMEDERNFLPQYVKNPNRFDNKPDLEKCTALGLSFFEQASQANDRFAYLKSRVSPAYHPAMETNLAMGVIKQEFGKTGEANDFGHFTHFPFEEAVLSKYFTIVSPL